MHEMYGSFPNIERGNKKNSFFFWGGHNVGKKSLDSELLGYIFWDIL